MYCAMLLLYSRLLDHFEQQVYFELLMKLLEINIAKKMLCFRGNAVLDY